VKERSYDPQWKARLIRDFLGPLTDNLLVHVSAFIFVVLLLFGLLWLSSLFR
jgi:hypothetical protein